MNEFDLKSTSDNEMQVMQQMHAEMKSQDQMVPENMRVKNAVKE